MCEVVKRMMRQELTHRPSGRDNGPSIAVGRTLVGYEK